MAQIKLMITDLKTHNKLSAVFKKIRLTPFNQCHPCSISIYAFMLNSYLSPNNRVMAIAVSSALLPATPETSGLSPV